MSIVEKGTWGKSSEELGIRGLLCLGEERTTEEEVSGGALASFSICVGAVEVEADGPALTLEAVPPPVLWIMASFKTSLAFLRSSKDGRHARSMP